MSALHPVTPQPHKTARIIFAACVITAPLFWFGQLLLGYGTWAYGCYPGDHPVRTGASHGIYITMMLFDGVSLLAAIVAGGLSFGLWRTTRDRLKSAPEHIPSVVEQRTRFMALWGMLFSGCFLIAIVFASIASLMVPPCG